ncbi:MAG: hypothetical protein GY934_17285 [Gammaproteobacteria bacterium]|nr:hypothetical protein [Gammaproteobacteria bacterium]
MSMVLSACGGSGDIGPPTQEEILIGEITVSDIGPRTATVSFSTLPESDATVRIWLSTDHSDEPALKMITSGKKRDHTVSISGLWSSARWRAEVSAGSASSSIHFQSAEPEWPGSACRQGSLALPVSANALWSTYSDVNGTVNVRTTPGCNGSGSAARFDFNLGDGEWVVAQSDDFSSVLDLTPYSHLWIPFRGTENVPVALEIKIRDVTGGLSMVRLDGGVGVPVWRSWAVDIREFRPQLGELDWSAVSGIEVGFSMPLAAVGARSAIVELADLQAWNLTDERPMVSGFERVGRDERSMAGIAADLLAHQRSHGFLTAWFELAPNLHLYANAMALIVFTLEYERLHDLSDTTAAAYLDAARRMADSLVTLQTLSARGGAWDDSFIEKDGNLVLHAAGSRTLWVGSTAWAGIALILARDILPGGDVYDDTIAAAADYYADLQSCRSSAGLPSGSITEGSEGNISSHLFLQAAVARGLTSSLVADRLAAFIGDQLFDVEQQRFFCGVRVDYGGGFDESVCALAGGGTILGGDARSCLDVIGNWGSEWLLRQGRTQDALMGLAYGRYVFPTRSFADPAVDGLGDIAGPWTPTVEHGAGQWAAAGGPDSSYILQQAESLLCSGGACQGAADNLSAGIGWNTVSTGVAPAAWIYIARHGAFWSRL